MIDMEQIIFAAFALETALLIPLLIVGYAEPLDEKLFCKHGRKCKLRNNQMVCRHTENKAVGEEHAKRH